MDTPSLSPTSDRRLRDKVIEVIGSQALRTEQVIAALPEANPASVRQTLSRLGRSGDLSSPTYGVWAKGSRRRTMRKPTPRQEIVIPGSTTDELVTWAENITEANPISSGIPPFRPSGHLAISDRLFMGVELTFTTGDKPVFTLAIFADIPNTDEEQIMQDNYAPEGANG